MFVDIFYVVLVVKLVEQLVILIDLINYVPSHHRSLAEKFRTLGKQPYQYQI